MSRLFTICLGAAGLCAATLPSQDDAVVANTKGKNFATGVQVVRQDSKTCRTIGAISTNSQSSITFGNTLFNGGAAYDAARSGVWITNGFNLTCIDPASGKMICAQRNLPLVPHRGKLSPYSVNIGGLAYDNRDNVLYAADAINGDLYRVPLGTAADPRACAFSNKSCEIKKHMPASHWLGGLAIDQVRRLLFVGSFHMTTKKPHVYVASLDKWCDKIGDVTGANAKFPSACPTSAAPLTQIQGLAFDSARNLLHVTDGRTVSTYRYSHAQRELAIVRCCKNPNSSAEGTYVSLAAMPRRAVTAGRSCTAAPCATCPTLALAANGDAALGNPRFRLELNGLPSNARLAALGLGAGTCATPGVNVGLCTRVTVATNALISLGMAVKTGQGQCGGQASLGVPIPANSALFGAELSAQSFAMCPSSPTSGHALSNCVGFSITRN